MVIDKTIFLTNAPSTGDVIWAKPIGDKIILHMYNRGKWIPVSGGGSDSSSENGSGCNCNNEEPILVTADFNLDYILGDVVIKILQERGYNVSSMEDAAAVLQTLSEEEASALIAEAMGTLTEMSFTTENHGKVVKTVYVQDTLRFLCEDGYIVKLIGSALSETPPFNRYYFSPASNAIKDGLTGESVNANTVHKVTDVIQIPGRNNTPAEYLHLNMVYSNGSTWCSFEHGYTGNHDDTEYFNVHMMDINWEGDIDAIELINIPLKIDIVETIQPS